MMTLMNSSRMTATSTDRSMPTPPKLGRGRIERSGRSTGSVSRARTRLVARQSAVGFVAGHPAEERGDDENPDVEGDQVVDEAHA